MYTLVKTTLINCDSRKILLKRDGSGFTPIAFTSIRGWESCLARWNDSFLEILSGIEGSSQIVTPRFATMVLYACRTNNGN